MMVAVKTLYLDYKIAAAIEAITIIGMWRRKKTENTLDLFNFTYIEQTEGAPGRRKNKNKQTKKCGWTKKI